MLYYYCYYIAITCARCSTICMYNIYIVIYIYIYTHIHIIHMCVYIYIYTYIFVYVYYMYTLEQTLYNTCSTIT